MKGQSQVDAILEQLGPLKAYAILQWCGYALGYFAMAFQLLAIVFVGHDVDFTCRPPDRNASSLLDNISAVVFQQEHQFTTKTNFTTSGYSVAAAERGFDEGSSILVPGESGGSGCSNDIIYTVPKDISFVSQFDLVREKAALVGLTQTLLAVGQFLGSLFLSIFNDRWGRKRMLFVMQALLLASGVVNAFSPNYVVFAVSKVFIGLSLVGLRLVISTSLIEIFPARFRSGSLPVIGGILFALCVCLMSFLAYALRHNSWRTLQLVFTSPSLLIVLQFLIIDEPIRFLLANPSRHKEARRVIQKAAKWNKVNLVILDQYTDILLFEGKPPKVDCFLNMRKTEENEIETPGPDFRFYEIKSPEIENGEIENWQTETTESFVSDSRHHKTESGDKENQRPKLERNVEAYQRLDKPTENGDCENPSRIDDTMQMALHNLVLSKANNDDAQPDSVDISLTEKGNGKECEERLISKEMDIESATPNEYSKDTNTKTYELSSGSFQLVRAEDTYDINPNRDSARTIPDSSIIDLQTTGIPDSSSTNLQATVALLKEENEHSEEKHFWKGTDGIVYPTISAAPTVTQHPHHYKSVSRKSEIQDPESESSEIKSEDVKLNLLDVLRHPRMRMNLFACCMLWFVNSTAYFGLYLMSGALAGDLYVNFFINGLVEIPCCIAYMFTLEKIGRKWTLFIFQMLAGVGLVLAGICLMFPVNSSLIILSTALSFIGKLGATGAINVGLMYTAEIFPTNCRNQSLGVASAAGRAGAMIAPFGLLLVRKFTWAPGVIVGSCSLAVASILLLLPETKGRELPQTVEDLEKWYRKRHEEQ